MKFKTPYKLSEGPEFFPCPKSCETQYEFLECNLGFLLSDLN